MVLEVVTRTAGRSIHSYNRSALVPPGVEPATTPGSKPGALSTDLRCLELPGEIRTLDRRGKPSALPTELRILGLSWWGRLDSNQRPVAYQTTANSTTELRPYGRGGENRTPDTGYVTPVFFR